MKKTLIFLITLFSSFVAQAQTVSLDPTYLQLPRLAVNPACSVDDRGKVIYNTTAEKFLYCNGTVWIDPAATPVTSTYTVAGLIGGVPFGGVAAQWTLVGPSVTVNVNGQQTITASMVAVFGHASSNPQPVSFSVCYQKIDPMNPGNITAFYTNAYPDGTVMASPIKTALSAAAAVKLLPAGNYRVSFCIKNKSGSVNFSDNGFVNGFVCVF